MDNKEEVYRIKRRLVKDMCQWMALCQIVPLPDTMLKWVNEEKEHCEIIYTMIEEGILSKENFYNHINFIKERTVIFTLLHPLIDEAIKNSIDIFSGLV